MSKHETYSVEVWYEVTDIYHFEADSETAAKDQAEERAIMEGAANSDGITARVRVSE